LVVEDDEKNLANCKKAYQPLVEKGLVLPIYVTNGDEAEKYVDKVDAGILDLYFPGSNAREKIEEFAEKYRIPNPPEYHIPFDLDAVKIKDLYPLGIYYGDKLAEREKPIIFVSAIASGHGSEETRTNPFYILRGNVKYNPFVPIKLALAFCACESAERLIIDGAFISYLLGELGSPEGIYQKIREDIEKTEEAWLAALKTIAGLIGNEEIYKTISLKDKKVEEVIECCWKNKKLETNMRRFREYTLKKNSGNL